MSNVALSLYHTKFGHAGSRLRPEKFRNLQRAPNALIEEVIYKDPDSTGTDFQQQEYRLGLEFQEDELLNDISPL